jgi:hypothetical protein
LTSPAWVNCRLLPRAKSLPARQRDLDARHVHAAGPRIRQGAWPDPLQLGLIWSFAVGGKLFAYRFGMLIVGDSYGYFEARDLVRVGAWLAVVEFFTLMFVVPFHWPLIGIRLFVNNGFQRHDFVVIL